ncbi:class I SAM-dependent methyltransferase [Myxococcus landrumensis]|uniref:Class I SAM-dependent methyltransferase n=1 Tax=Myxococcus landrumensis TaxID=2813577 RepID=A0ABX7NE66_9BACT|nr:class I SAM-dependent methyltransferase [Myxococcus landrumus]QSQ17097.1 class I SAM-dependent methyltransferase [Myxococcus landrumus]
MTSKGVAVLAKEVGDDWKEHAYYEEVERFMPDAWKSLIWPIIGACDFSSTLDLAAGHGRNTEFLLPLARGLHVVDINKENIDFCRRRFKGRDAHVRYVVNNGSSLSALRNDSVTLVYCFDAMVHFDSDVVRNYLREFFRILEPGSHAFIHHSNYTGNPCGKWMDNPNIRNFMSKELFAHYAHKEGLTVSLQKEIEWGGHSDLDCLSLLRKPNPPQRLSGKYTRRDGMLFVLAGAHESVKFSLARPGTLTLEAHAHPWCGRLVVKQAGRVLATFDVHEEKAQAKSYVFEAWPGELSFHAEDRGGGRGEAWVKNIDIQWKKTDASPRS